MYLWNFILPSLAIILFFEIIREVISMELKAPKLDFLFFAFLKSIFNKTPRKTPEQKKIEASKVKRIRMSQIFFVSSKFLMLKNVNIIIIMTQVISRFYIHCDFTWNFMSSYAYAILSELVPGFCFINAYNTIPRWICNFVHKRIEFRVHAWLCHWFRENVTFRNCFARVYIVNWRRTVCTTRYN